MEHGWRNGNEFDLELAQHTTAIASTGGPSPWAVEGETATNERQIVPAERASWLPRDAVAHIYRPARSAMTSGKARIKNWILRFERRTPLFVEPLMGWTGDDDTLTQIELTFPTGEAAVAYAERHGLNYVVRNGQSAAGTQTSKAQEQRTEQEASEQIAAPALLPAWSQARSGRCAPTGSPELGRALVSPAAVFGSPEEVVRHPALSLNCKREILRRWAWDAYLLELASDEAMPEGEPSRLDEVMTALHALKNMPDVTATALVFTAGTRGRISAV